MSTPGVDGSDSPILMERSSTKRCREHARSSERRLRVPLGSGSERSATADLTTNYPRRAARSDGRQPNGATLPLSLDELKLPRLETGAVRAHGNGIATATNLSECMNLAPAGTGSQSLSDALMTATGGGHWHHDHFRRIETASAIEAARCFIVTIRDPAERLASGFRYLNRFWRGPTLVKTLADFVAAARDPAHAAHAEVIRFYLESVAWPKPVSFRIESWDALTTCSRPGPLRLGDLCFFLTSQLDFLRGFRPAIDELHAVCTEEFDADWDALMQHFELPSLPVTHRHAWNGGKRRPLADVHADDAAFVRECLYPWDVKLHRDLCRERTRHSVDMVLERARQTA